MIIEKVMLNKYEGPDGEDVTVGKIYEVLPFTYEDDGEYVIRDNKLQQHVVDPEWCTVVEDAFGKRDIVGKPSGRNNSKWYPEVGSYCSLYKNPDVNTSKDDSLIHNKIKILAYDAGDVVYRVVDGKYFPIESQKDIQFIFKPFKSEKDKEIEKIMNVWEDAMPLEAFAERLYENGFRFVEK